MQAVESATETMRFAQRAWSATPLRERLAILRRARHLLAASATSFTAAISPELARNPADTLVSEVLPLLDACRFLERRATKILATHTLGRRGRPFWLAGVASSVERAPLGIVLLIAPSNYPLLLAGVQALQALAAGNAVMLKPGDGGGRVAALFAETLSRAGLPQGLLRVTGETVRDAELALADRPDLIVFTGSSQAGTAVARAAAAMGTPMIAELSGCDAVVVLPSADAVRVLDALCFGMRLNGSAVCMAPRRLFLVGDAHADLPQRLRERFAGMAPVSVPARIRAQLQSVLAEAASAGAAIHGDADASTIRPILIEDAAPTMLAARADLFAPLLSVLHVHDTQALLEADRACPFGLTFAIFGDEAEALAVGSRITAGTVVINDLIVPTVDPRVPFGGRRASGYGVTRGAEGLLAMTAPKTVAIRRGQSLRHYEATTEEHQALFTSLIEVVHGATWAGRWRALRGLSAAARHLQSSRLKTRKQGSTQ